MILTMRNIAFILLTGFCLLYSCNKVVINPLPKVETLPASIIDMTHVTLYGNVISEGQTAVTIRGFCWALTPNPTVDQNFCQNTFGPGEFSETITVLTDTTYYIKTFATNASGTTYGNQVEVNTSAVLPVLTTFEITEITSTTARSGGLITSDGGKSILFKGICYSTTSNPSIEDSLIVNDSSSTSFTSVLLGLLPNRTYHVRAYATNTMGTGYGNERSFSTPMEIPIVTTNEVEDITSFSAKVGGVIISAGGGEITEQGVYWSDSPNPTTSGTKLPIEGGLDRFSQTILGLATEATYYVQAFATNNAGTDFGDVVSFTPTWTSDGNLSKWDLIPDFAVGAGGTITRVKLTHDKEYIHIYIEGTKRLRGFFDIYIDADNNTETGASTWLYPAGCGADYLVEGYIAGSGFADLFQDDPNTTDWAWIGLDVGQQFAHASKLMATNIGKAIEFSLLRTMLPLLGTTIHFGFVDVDEDWSMQGGLPIIGAQDSKLLEYVLD